MWRAPAKAFAIAAAIAVGTVIGPSAQADTESGLYVEIRADDSPTAPVTERYKLYGASYALVIGNDNYRSGWPRLSNAIRDAESVTAALREQGFQVDLLTDVTSEELRTALRRFFVHRGSDPDARLFVWFSGHGHTEFDEGYLVPVDAPLPEQIDFLEKALHMRDVGSMVRIARAKHVLAVFDSCFAGTVFSAQRSRPSAAITRATAQPVRQFLTSGDADQRVSDDGLFRELFLRALRGEEAADANRDGYLTGTELGLYLEDRVTNLTQALQTPRSGKLRDARFDRGDFIFKLPTRGADTTSQQAANQSGSLEERGILEQGAPPQTSGLEPPGRESTPPLISIAGRWNANVIYDWGDEHSERFKFTVLGDELHGTASFLGLDRGILEGRLREDKVTFITKTREVLGNREDPRTQIHRYTGLVTGNEIRFIMLTEGGHSEHVPVEFTATRMAN